MKQKILFIIGILFILFLSSLSYADDNATILKNALIFNYPFSDSYEDIEGNSDITNNGCGFIDSPLGRGVQCNASDNDYLDYGFYNLSDGNFSTGDFSVVLIYQYIDTAGSNSDNVFFSNRIGAVTYWVDFPITYNAGAGPAFVGSIKDKAANTVNWDTATINELNDASWQMLSMTYDQNGNALAYLNTTLKQTITSQGIDLYSPSQNFYAGRYTTNYFNIKMDNVLIFNKSLSSDEVKYLFNDGSFRDLSFNGIFESPTPPSGSTNNTQVIINVSCGSGDIDLWFDNETNPSTLVLDDGTTPASYTTSVTESDIYYYKASCNNGLTNSSTRSWTYDAVSPSIALNPNNYFNASNVTLDSTSENLLFNYTATDNIDLFATSINVTKDGIVWFNYTNSTLYGTSELIIKNISMYNWPNGIYDTEICVSDSHTALSIPDYSSKTKLNEIEFDTTEGNNIKIRSQSTATTSSTKNYDRYNFAFDFQDKRVGTKIFDVYCDGKLSVRNTKYDGHLVCSKDGLNGNWIDFEGIGINEKPTLSKVTDNHYQVIFNSLGDKVTFNSIGGLNVNCFDYEFELERYGIDNCTLYNNLALVFQLYDENYPSKKINGTAEIEVFFGSIDNINLFNYTTNYPLSNNFSLCVYPSFSTVYSDLYLKYTDAFTHSFYLNNYSFSNNTDYINIYNWNTTDDSSDLVIITRNIDTYGYLNDIYVSLQRKYLDEGVWRTVQMDRSGAFGSVFFNIKEEDTDYRLIYKDKNNNILEQTTSSKFVCDAGVCQFTELLNTFTAEESIKELQVNTTFNNDTGILKLIWEDPTGVTSNVRLKVSKETLTGTNVICSYNSSGNAGFYNCNLTGYDGQVLIRIWSSASPETPVISEWIKIFTSADLGSLIGNVRGAFWSFSIILTTAGAGALLGIVGAIIGTIVGIIASLFLGVFSGLTVTFIIIAATLGLLISLKVKQ